MDLISGTKLLSCACAQLSAPMHTVRGGMCRSSDDSLKNESLGKFNELMRKS